MYIRALTNLGKASFPGIRRVKVEREEWWVTELDKNFAQAFSLKNLVLQKNYVAAN